MHDREKKAAQERLALYLSEATEASTRADTIRGKMARAAYLSIAHGWMDLAREITAEIAQGQSSKANRQTKARGVTPLRA